MMLSEVVRGMMKYAITSALLLLLAGCQDSGGEVNEEVNGQTDEQTADQEDVMTLPVLMYHDFSEDVEDSLTVHPEDLDDHLTALYDAGYETVTDQDIVDFREGDEDALPDQPILITIDDGYVSNYELAYPIFEEHEMKATIYVIAERRDTGYDNHFTWEQAREMQDSGWINIQHHSYNHHEYVETASGGEEPILVAVQPEETQEEYRERIHEDLQKAKERIEEEVGNHVHSLTFPYGRYNEEVLEVSREIGLDLFFTVREAMNGMEEIETGILHRFNVPGGMSGDELIAMLENRDGEED